MTKKIKFKYKAIDIPEDYCWVVGLSLIIAGIVSLINNSVALFVTGIIIAAVGVFLKGRIRK
ncbi:hypothetical protein HYV50_03420 [Candidatus Pacearchaeota archaeon]|nr:hypothetical protein [Candidatus Pacearchaeota archaeon]